MLLFFNATKITHDYLILTVFLILPYFGYLSKNNYFSSDWSCKMVDSVCLNSKFRHGCSSAYVKILNTIQNTRDYLISFVFLILPDFCYL